MWGGRMSSYRKYLKIPPSPWCLEYYYYKDLFTHKDINTYINGVV